MRLKTVAKLSVFISVLLFCVAVGFYAIARLDMTERNREVDLYSLVPSDCVGVLESDNISAFLNEIPSLNYGKELDGFQFPGLFEFLLHQLNEYAVQNAHGLSSQMNHLMVSFHAPGSVRDQVLYFRMGGSDQQMLEDMLKEYAPANFLPKEEKYRGKTIWVYPLGQDEFLAAYSGAGFMALSYQKRLIEQVIDAKLDKNSLNVDPVFSQILAKKKSHHFLTLYGRSAAMPFLNSDAPCWCEFEFHLNSDVLYLTGETYHSEPDDAFSVMPPKNSPKIGIGTLGRKCEQRASFFYAAKGSFRSPLLQYRFQFVPRSLVDFFEASHYGVLANGGNSSSTAVAVPLLPQEKAYFSCPQTGEHSSPLHA